MVSEIAENTGISKERVRHILTEDLGIEKITARWLPRLLTQDRNRIRMNISKALLKLFKRNNSKFWRRLITVDETWIHDYTPEGKTPSKQRTATGESAPNMAETVPSAGKVMATVFWDSRGAMLIDYLEKGKTITGAYYASILDKLKEQIAEKRPHLKRKKISFHQDNASSHTSMVAMAKIYELTFEFIDHPPY